MKMLSLLERRAKAWRMRRQLNPKSHEIAAGRIHRRTAPHPAGFPCLALALALTLIFFSACNRNNKKSSLPPQATAPVIIAPPTVPASPAPPVQTTPPPATSAETGVIPQPSPKANPKPPKKSAGKTAPAAPKQAAPAQAAQAPQTAQPTQPAPPAQPAPPKPPATGAGEGQTQIAAQVPWGTAQSTEQLLQTAEGNLRKVTRQLSDSEQAMLRQARTYIAQSRAATQDGDLERAYNLAIKANLLSGELAK
jgi:outer membrane biosynthesis protein TonB